VRIAIDATTETTEQGYQQGVLLGGSRSEKWCACPACGQGNAGEGQASDDLGVVGQGKYIKGIYERIYPPDVNAILPIA
jgi:hypothetical protein